MSKGVERGRPETVVDGFDMATRGDREAVSRGIASGWKVEPEKLQQYREALDEALRLSLEAENPRHIVSCVRAMHSIVAQVQHDEDKESGHADGVNVTVVWQDG